MNNCFVKLSIGVLCGLMALTGCNGDDDNINFDDVEIPVGDVQSSTAIKSFNIKPNTKILAHMDSVFFTIDLLEARIFNADSLPYGTDVSKLTLNIGTDEISKVTINYIDANTLEEKEIEYSSSSKDSVNFTQPVTMTVLSSNELQERTYDVKVNVHKMKPDSLCWGSMEYSWLPAPDDAYAQKTVKFGQKVYCLAAMPDGYSVASSATPADAGSWQSDRLQLSFTPDVNSFTATDDALYLMSKSGDVYTSIDAVAWTATSATGWHNLIGAYGTTLLGIKSASGSYSMATYPVVAAADATPLPDDFPVDGQSQTLTFNSEWSANPQVLFVGGRCADGSLSSGTWGFDGTQWVRFSDLPKKTGLEGVSLFQYSTFTVNTVNWTVQTYPSLIAVGGRDASGNQSRKVYISRDWGMNWHLADDLMTLPEEMPAPAFAQAVVVDSTLGENAPAATGWYPVTTLAPNALWWDVWGSEPTSRAVAPITSWQCPYIYLFGGLDENDVLLHTIWRGAINRMTFKPLQ